MIYHPATVMSYMTFQALGGCILSTNNACVHLYISCAKQVLHNYNNTTPPPPKKGNELKILKNYKLSKKNCKLINYKENKLMIKLNLFLILIMIFSSY